MCVGRECYLKHQYFQKLLNYFGDQLNSKDKLKFCSMCLEGKFSISIIKLKLNKAPGLCCWFLILTSLWSCNRLCMITVILNVVRPAMHPAYGLLLDNGPFVPLKLAPPQQVCSGSKHRHSEFHCHTRHLHSKQWNHHKCTYVSAPRNQHYYPGLCAHMPDPAPRIPPARTSVYRWKEEQKNPSSLHHLGGQQPSPPSWTLKALTTKDPP